MSKSQASLYRTFNPKYVTYPNDGDGRDKYISHNNGGLTTDTSRMATRNENLYCINKTNSLHNLRKESGFVTYRGDGTGRDSYVLNKNGGLVQEYKSFASYHLKDFLRTDAMTNFKFRKSKDDKRPQYMSKKEKSLIEGLRRTEKSLIEKLYPNKMIDPCKSKRYLEMKSFNSDNYNHILKTENSDNYNPILKTEESTYNTLPNLSKTERNLPKTTKSSTSFRFNNLNFKSQVNRITNYEEVKRQANIMHTNHSPDKSKLLFEYFNGSLKK